MKKKSKIAIGLTATITAGALAISLPSLAHDREDGSSQGRGYGYGYGSEAFSERAAKKMASSNFATVEASITGIPTDISSLREAAEGANFEAYRLADDATSVPDAKPDEEPRVISIRPTMDDAGNLEIPEIVNREINATLGFKASNDEGVTKLALYPSDGSAAILVTLTTDADGNTVATASSDLTVAFDQEVADAFEPGKMGKGGPGKGRMGHGPGHDHKQDESVSDSADLES